MRRTLLGVVLVVSCASCGGKVLSDTTSGSSGTTSGSPPTATITFPSPGNGTPPPPSTGPTPGRPPPPIPVTYTAQALPGGLDHIEIFKADFVNDRCVHLHLASPTDTTPFPDIVAPATWTVRSADRSSGASDCNFKSGRTPTSSAAGKGEVTWLPTAQVYPCALDLDVTLVAPDGTVDTMTSKNVAVIGGGC